MQIGVLEEARIFENLIEERYEEYRYDLKRPLLPPNELFINYKDLVDVIQNKDVYKFKLEKSLEIRPKVQEIKARNEKSDINYQKLPNKGDLVVHLTHGIGSFNGLTPIKTFLGISDCLEIEYADNSKVYVPIEHMNLVSKYFGPIDRSIDTLGSKRWVKRKNKALKQTFDTAAELLEVQAKRANKEGFSYDIPIKEFKYFCSQFPYQETYDQKRTIDEVIVEIGRASCRERV